MAENRRAFGASGEKLAAEYLKNNGYRIITVNFRYSRLGEIDIIAHDAEYLCFVEVKTRRSLIYGTPAEAITKGKQNNIKKLAQIYISKNRLFESNVRFDVVEILIKKGINTSTADINLIKNAF